MFGLLLRFLTCQRRELGPVLADLIGEELPLRRNQHGIGILWYDEISGYPFAARQCGAEARDVEPLGHEIVMQTIALCGVHRRIELDQQVARLDRLPVLHVNGAHHAGLERLDHLASPARHDLAGCGGHDVDRARSRPGQRRADKQHEGQGDGAADRRWRCFRDFQRRRQEGDFLGAPALSIPERDHGLLRTSGRHSVSRPHKCLPGDDAGRHSGRRS